jgi:tetratricopeptide (TPR) repeat protein
MSADAFTAALQTAQQLEAQHDLPGAFAAYEAALALSPGAPEVVSALARLAFRLRDYAMAEKLYDHLMRHGQADIASVCGHAAALRELGRLDEAIALLQPIVAQNTGIAQLWRALGEVMSARVDPDNALIFYNEALRLAPDDAASLLLRGCELIATGNGEAGLADIAAAVGGFDDPDDDASAAISHAQALLNLGRLDEGWQAYEARYRYGATQEVHYGLLSPHWRPGQTLAGLRLLVCGEQGLGDEVLFASLLPDLLRDLGPDGRLTLAVEPRLVALFARSFPQAHVIAHSTRQVDGRLQRSFPGLDQNSIDQWALMGDFLPVYRARIDDFPADNVFLRADPDEVAAWRTKLSAVGDGPKVGVLWKSLKKGTNRDPFFAPFEAWRDLLATPGVQFVNLQYGDSEAEIRLAESWGAPMHAVPGLDLKDDLDDVASLSCALDLIIAPSNATSNIAAACGAEVWLVMPGQSWTQLGADNYVWYPTARTFATDSLKDWSGVMRQLRQALSARFAQEM